MVVYLEYSLIQNFLLDGLLLYLTLKCLRIDVKMLRIVASAVVGGVQSIVFPLLSVPIWCSYCLKFLGGALLVVIALKSNRIRCYFWAIGVFFLLTFSFGGALTAIYSFAEVKYVEGNGYIVESAPVTLILVCAIIFTIFLSCAIKRFYQVRITDKFLVSCILKIKNKEIRLRGFIDNGNQLFFRGEPVCVVSPVTALALFGKDCRSVGRIFLHTVNSCKYAPVFLCDGLCIRTKTLEKTLSVVYVTVGTISSKDYQIILHSAFMEDSCDDIIRVKSMVTEDTGRGERRSLLMRK